MATIVAVPPALPALDKALEIQGFPRSRELYNNLLDDTEQPPVADAHIQNLAALFVRHNAHKVLGVHLIHGHFKIPENTVMLGTNFEEPRGRWTRITQIETIDTTTVHGHIFVVDKEGLCSYEYQNGPMPDLSGIHENFLLEFVDYLVANDLTGLLGLQVLYECGDQSMSELILDDGTVMLDSSVAKGCEPYRTTGWQFEVEYGHPRVCTKDEKHAKMTSGNHKIFDAGRLRPNLETVDELKVALTEAGVL